MTSRLWNYSWICNIVSRLKNLRFSLKLHCIKLQNCFRRQQIRFEDILSSKEALQLPAGDYKTKPCAKPIVQSKVDCSLEHLHVYGVRTSPCFYYVSRVMTFFKQGVDEAFFSSSSYNLFSCKLQTIPFFTSMRILMLYVDEHFFLHFYFNRFFQSRSVYMLTCDKIIATCH